MIKELKEMPIPDEGKGIIAAVIGIVSLVMGWLVSGFITQAVFGAAVFLLLSGMLEWEKQRTPDKYPEGFIGFGADYDDIGLGLAAVIMFLISAALDLYVIAAILTIIALFFFMEMEDDRRENDSQSRRRRNYY